MIQLGMNVEYQDLRFISLPVVLEEFMPPKWKSDQSQDSSEEQGRSKDLPEEEEVFWAPYLSITTIS